MQAANKLRLTLRPPPNTDMSQGDIYPWYILFTAIIITTRRVPVQRAVERDNFFFTLPVKVRDAASPIKYNGLRIQQPNSLAEQQPVGR